MTELTDPPSIVPRPKLAVWMYVRGLKPKDGAAPLGVKGEQVRRYCLPFDDPMRVVPPPKVMPRIVAWTAGEITANDFHPSLAGAEPVQ